MKEYIITAGALAFLIASFLAIFLKGRSGSHPSGRIKRRGMLTAIPFLSAVALFFAGNDTPSVSGAARLLSLAVLSFLVSHIPGLLAAIAADKVNHGEFKLTSERKTITGSVLFFLSSASIMAIALFTGNDFFIAPELPVIYILLTAISVAVILTVFEALSSRGFDLLAVPLTAVLLLSIFTREINYDLLKAFIFGIVLSLLVAFISFRVRFLTSSGSAATFLLAAFIFGFGGLKWSIPIMTFFLLSSILSKVRKNANAEVEEFFEKSGVRDYLQVAANGGIGGLLVVLNLLLNNELFYLIYLSSLAAVCADTWATEIGTLRKTRTYNILNMRPVQQGVSGGISLAGTSGALLGSVIIALSGYFFVGLPASGYFLVVILAGLFGSIIDSLLGATLQVQFQCGVCGKVTEKISHCRKITKYKSGLSWLNNDMVNLMAGFGGIIFLLIFQKLIF